eukprot:gene7024-66327_t
MPPPPSPAVASPQSDPPPAAGAAALCAAGCGGDEGKAEAGARGPPVPQPHQLTGGAMMGGG